MAINFPYVNLAQAVLIDYTILNSLVSNKIFTNQFCIFTTVISILAAITLGVIILTLHMFVFFALFTGDSEIQAVVARS